MSHAILRGSALASVVFSQAAVGAIYTDVARTVQVQEFSSLQTPIYTPPITNSDDQTTTDLSLTLFRSDHNLGNLGGSPPYLTNQVWWQLEGSSPLGGGSFVGSRLWTGATGSGTHLMGDNQCIVDLTFSVSGAGGLPWAVWGTSGPHPGLINPVGGSVYQRGFDFKLTDDGGTILSQAVISTNGFNSVSYESFNTPYQGTLLAGVYHMRARAWAQWDGVDQNGNGWSDAFVQWTVGTIPSPGGAISLIGAGVVASLRRRRIT